MISSKMETLRAWSTVEIPVARSHSRDHVEQHLSERGRGDHTAARWVPQGTSAAADDV